MVDVYLLRHGHVDYTPPAQITRRNPLTPLGHTMAARLARRCDEWDLQFIFVSQMLRAQQTANAISMRFPDVPRVDMPEFEEVSLADLMDYRGTLPAEDMHTWEDEHFAHGNRRMWERVLGGWSQVRRFVDSEGLQRVAIIAHEGPFNALIRHFLGQEPTELRQCWLTLGHASASCLRYSADRRWIRWTNDGRHVEDLVRPLQ